MLIFGKVTEVQPSTGRCRVTFESEDNLVSSFLPTLQLFSGKNKSSRVFSINEYVACFMDDNLENGVILGAIYTNKNIPPNASESKFSIRFSDNALIEYDTDSGKLTVDGVKSVFVNSQQSVNIECISANIKAQTTLVIDSPTVTVTGTLSAAGITSSAGISATGQIEASGGVKATGDIEASGDVKAGVISLKTHKHPGVTSGSSITGIPTP